MTRALVLSFTHPDIVPGGAQQVAYNLHVGLKRAGHDSYFLAFHDRLPPQLRSDATPIVKMPQRDNEYIVNVAGFDYEHFVGCSRWVFEALMRFVDGIEPEIIFVHHFMLTGIDLLVALRKRFRDARFVFTAHEFLPICKRDGHLVRTNGQLCTSHTPFDCVGCFPGAEPKDFSVRYRMFHQLFDQCDLVITPSGFQAEIMARHFDFPDRVAVVPNGSFDHVPTRYSGTARQGRGETLAYFGQVLRDKGVGFLLHQLPALLAARKQLKIDIWGSGLNLNRPEFQQDVLQAVKLINEGFGGNRVELKGAYDNRRVIDTMAQYDCVVFPSLWPETFSMVFSEALIAGCKVIAPAIGAFRERATEAGDNAYLYTLGDSLSFSVAVNAALSTPYHALSPQAGHHLSIDAMTAAYLAVSATVPTERREASVGEITPIEPGASDDLVRSDAIDSDSSPVAGEHELILAADDIVIVDDEEPESNMDVAPEGLSHPPSGAMRRRIVDLPMPTPSEPTHNPFAAIEPAPSPLPTELGVERARKVQGAEKDGKKRRFQP